jgi:N,N'-diacetyllegionaminate synthase
MKTFIIAEAGVNHNGQEDLALKLVEAAARCGADAVKFQSFSAAKLVRPGAEKAAYQKANTGAGDQFEMLKALEMSATMHQAIYDRCQALDIEFMSTAFDEEAADYLVNLGMKRLKIPSGEITNFPFLLHAAKYGLPIILSTGMSDMAEIEQAVGVLQQAWVDASHSPGSFAESITILHCTSNYPAANADVNLRAMQTIAKATGLPVGYSDHTLGLAVSTAAVALGATVIEKHFTLDRAMPGPDHKASLTPQELDALVKQIRAVEEALGSPEKAPTESEIPVRALVRRSVSAARDLDAGTILQSTDLTLLRPGTGISPASLHQMFGRIIARDIAAGTTLQWDDLV